MISQPVVWINGELQPPETASIHWSDHGITVGDGVFETIKLAQGLPFALTRHLDRLEHSAAGLRLPPPPRAYIADAVSLVVETWGSATGRLRITLTGGAGPMGSDRGDATPTLMVTAGTMTMTREPTTVVSVPWTRNERGALAGLKTTSYAENVVALHVAAESGASEAIFANTRGELCEGTGSNVFLEHRGTLCTPHLDSGCLAGVTRALLIEALEAVGVGVEESHLPMAALAGAREAFLVSTGREVQPISAVDGHQLTEAPGQLTLLAMKAWDDAYSGATDP